MKLPELFDHRRPHCFVTPEGTFRSDCLLPEAAEFLNWSPEIGPRGARRWRNLDSPNSRPVYDDPGHAPDPSKELESGENVHGDTMHAAGLYKVHQDGRPFFFKTMLKEEAHREVMTAELAHIAGVPVVPVKMGVLTGVGIGVISPWVDAPNAITAAGKPTTLQDFNAYIDKSVPRSDVEKHLLHTYLTSAEDRHAGNFLVHQGRLLGIDYEQTFFHDAQPHSGISAMLDCAIWTDGRTFEKATVEHMAKASSAMAAHAERRGGWDEAAVIRKRGEHLRKWAESGDLTQAGLEKVL